MSYHVDMLAIDPLVGTQTLLGRVFADSESGLQIEGDDQLRETVMRIVPDIDPSVAPAEFLDALAKRTDYTYMIASAAHEIGECHIHAVGDTVRGGVEHHTAQPA